MSAVSDQASMMSRLEDDIIANIAKKMQQQIDVDVFKMLGGPEYQLLLDSGTVFGEKYYTAQPAGWGFLEGEARWNEMITWVVDVFGPTAEDGVWTPDMRWYVNNTKFWFKDQKDLTMFVLRWS